MRRAGPAIAGALALVGAQVGGCAAPGGPNGAYPATDAQVRDHMERMRDNPVGVERPVVVLGGWRSPPSFVAKLSDRVEDLTGAAEGRVVPMSYAWAGDIEPLGGRVVELVEARWPSDHPELTTEVDVVGLSMGGLVARWAAADRGDGAKRLNIGTLYTLATPHAGARLTETFRVDAASRQMRAGSEFLVTLDEALEESEYEIVSYAVLNDLLVGARRAAPPGEDPIWAPGPPLMSHHLVSKNERILADLAARLRGEEPLGRPSPPPSQ